MHKVALKLITLLMIAVVALASCKQKRLPANKSSISKEYYEPLEKSILGNWETTYIKITYATYKKTDSSHVFEDNFKDSNSGKAQSTYYDNGTFIAWFKLTNGKKVGETKGEWKTIGDSLHVSYPYLGKNINASYHITQTKEGFEGRVIYDWDDDGALDDNLFMKIKRIK